MRGRAWLCALVLSTGCGGTTERPDAHVEPDAPDAFVAPDAFDGTDAFLAWDAYAVPDAYLAPDAARFESCDGTDDDRDGTTDEGCVCRPVVHDVPTTTPLLWTWSAAFGPGRVLAINSEKGDWLRSIDSETGDVPVIQPFGDAVTASWSAPWAAASGGFALVGQHTSQVLVHFDDFGVPTETVLPVPARMVSLGRPLDGDVLTFTSDDTRSWSVARIDGTTLAVRATATLATPLHPRFLAAPLLSGGVLLVTSGEDPGSVQLRVLVLDAALAVTSMTARTDTPGAIPAELAVTGDRIWLAERDGAGAFGLVPFDRTTGARGTPLPLGVVDALHGNGTSVHVAARGEHLFASWVDPSFRLHVSVRDASGIEIGHAELPAQPWIGQVFIGTATAGVRILSESGTGFRLIAPCDAL